MSGTSLDAVDAVLADFASGRPELIATHRHTIPAALREQARHLNEEPEAFRAADLAQLDSRFGILFAEAALALLGEAGAGIDAKAVRAIGSHGQTALHAPDAEPPYTVQLGDPNVIASRTGITTVADFRRRDLALGGQGAPLAPAFHAALLRSAENDRAVVNIGGIANVTVLPADGNRPVVGFDTGPGNALMDAWTARHLNQSCDTDGAWAAEGQVDESLLAALRGDPYFARRPPKSTGREDFSLAWLDRHLADAPRAPRDVEATLCELTAATIAEGITRVITGTQHEILVCGGGAHNTELMRRLSEHLPGWTVASTSRYGIDPDWVEALAFAWLARCTLRGEAGNLPEVTGASAATVLGGIYPAPP